MTTTLKPPRPIRTPPTADEASTAAPRAGLVALLDRAGEVRAALDELEREARAVLAALDAQAAKRPRIAIEPPQTLTLTIAEAARYMGIAPNTLRERIKGNFALADWLLDETPGSSARVRTLPWWDWLNGAKPPPESARLGGSGARQSGAPRPTPVR